MKTRTILMGVLFLALAASCKDDDDDNNNNNNNGTDLNATDDTFMRMAAYGNYNEVDAGQLAMAKATDTEVKNFGSMMVNDHQAALDELKSIAKTKGITLPAGPDPAHIIIKQQLSAMSGRRFDSAYIHLQVKDHQTTVDLFQNEQNNGRNSDVKNYSGKHLPGIRMHLRLADTLARRFK